MKAFKHGRKRIKKTPEGGFAPCSCSPLSSSCLLMLMIMRNHWLTLWLSLLLDHGIHLILNFTLPFDVCQLRSPLYPTLPWMCMNATQSSKANAQPSQKKPNMLVFCSKCVVIWQNDPETGPHLKSVWVYYWGPVAKMSRHCHQQLREIALVCSHHHLQHTAQEDKDTWLIISTRCVAESAAMPWFVCMCAQL